ncbi:hypothetical protein AB1Y20_005203 [Prymnesium parvum]|uniref:CUE domain-containing protein n=1 Tax=Prymnesium parvum TaxID=97485 RepID=A0AB34J3L0_PRYPA
MEALRAMFPDVAEEVIDDVLASSGHDPQLAAETLLQMASPPSPARSPSPASDAQQIVDDEALARLLQQQLLWEHDHLDHARRHPFGGAYPGAADAPRLLAPRPSQPPPSPEADGSLGDSLSSLGNAVYSASAATASAAGSLLTGLWSWATDGSEGAARGGGAARDGSPPPVELREVARRAPEAREREAEVARPRARAAPRALPPSAPPRPVQVVGRGEAAGGGAMRRRGVGATHAPRGMD